MSTPQPARKRLPVRPSEEHLKKQAKRRAKADAVGLAEAQHRLAGEYGCRSWAELMRVVETMNRGADQTADVRSKTEALPAAVRARDLAEVRRLLAAGEYTAHDLDKGLAHAAWYGGSAADVLAVRKEIFDLLLDHGADPDGQYGSAYGPIVLGTGECQSPEGLRWLIDAGCDVRFGPVDTKYGPVTPLTSWLGAYARSSDNTPKHRGIDLLLRHGAFVPPDLDPAVLAIHRGAAVELAKLIDADPTLVSRRFCHEYGRGNIDLRGATLLHAAVEFGETACVDVLLDAEPGLLAPDLWPPAIFVARSLPLTRLLLDRGLDPNVCSAPRKPLHLAADRGGIEIVRLLLSRGARVDVVDGENITPYELLCTNPSAAPDHVEIRQLLRDAGARDTIFTHLYRANDAAALAMLAADPALRDAVGPVFFSPLQTAALVASLPAVDALLAAGAAVDGANPAGNTPLWLVCQSDRPIDARLAVATRLLAAGADERRLCEHGTTPLDIAASRGPTEMADLLRRRSLERSAPADGPDEVDRFRTALYAGDATAVRGLLAASADLRGRINEPLGHFGARPVHAASQFPDVMHVLLNFGADINRRTDWDKGPFSVLDSAPESAARDYVRRGAILTAHAAARLGWGDELRQIVDADPAVVHEKGGDGQRPLHFAKTPAIADFLLDRGAEIDARCDDHHSTPAQYALADRPDVCRRLLGRGATPDVFMAARLGDLALADRLVDADPACLAARTNATGYAPVPPFNIYCWTLGWYLSPHEVALKFDQPATYERLLSRSPATVRFLIACARNDAAEAHRLVAAEPGMIARLSPQDHELLPYTMFYDRPAAAMLMLSLGFDPMATGTDGGTLLHVAAWHGNAAMVETLLRDHRGRIDLERRDTAHGGTPLGWAIHGSTNSFVKTGDHAAVIRLLRAAGAREG